MITITKEQLKKVFQEWQRLNRENPDDSYTDEELSRMSVEQCGKECADYFMEMLQRVKTGPDELSGIGR